MRRKWKKSSDIKLLQHSLTLTLLILIQCCYSEYAYSYHITGATVGDNNSDFFAKACTFPLPKAIKPYMSCSHRTQQIEQILTYNHNFSEFSPLLINRTLLMIGDSTMHNQFTNLCENFKALIWEGNRTSKCQFDSQSTTISFLGIGRQNEWADTWAVKHLQLIADTASALSHRDIILFGLGVHWHYQCGLQHPAGVGEDNFEYAVNKLMKLLPLVKKTHNNNSCVGAGCCFGNQFINSPRIIFRESFPQHFATSNGQYAMKLSSNSDTPRTRKLLIDSLPSRGNVGCPPLNKMSNSGAGTSTCNPNCLPATWQNDFISIKLEPYCIDTYHIFKHLICISGVEGQQRYRKGDCTHYKRPVHNYVNFLFMLKLRTGVWQH